MISSGYFLVSKEHLERLGREAGIQFLREMRDCGGRISHYAVEYWIKEMGWEAR